MKKMGIWKMLTIFLGLTTVVFCLLYILTTIRLHSEWSYEEKLRSRIHELENLR